MNNVTKLRKVLNKKSNTAKPVPDASNLDMRKGLLAPRKSNDMRSGQSEDPQFNRDKQKYQKDNEKIMDDYIKQIRKQKEEVLNGSKK